jgi:hypothetical protein
MITYNSADIPAAKRAMDNCRELFDYDSFYTRL